MTMNTATHTPTPWTAITADYAIEAANGYRVVDFLHVDAYPYNDEDKEIAAANAAFIVKACNAHDDLVAALQGILQITDRKHVAWDAAHAALAKAGAA